MEGSTAGEIRENQNADWPRKSTRLPPRQLPWYRKGSAIYRPINIASGKAYHGVNKAAEPRQENLSAR